MEGVAQQESADERREGRGLVGKLKYHQPMGGAMEGVAQQESANERRNGRSLARNAQVSSANGRRDGRSLRGSGPARISQ
jgi:hypothetical protein